MGKMARSDLHTADGVLDFLRFVLVAQTLQYCLTCMCVAESHNQAFIQTDKHLTYIDGDLSGVPLEISPGQTIFSDLQDENFYSSGIRLDPPMLDFEEQPVGMPRMEKVIVQNTDMKNSLHLLSISGSTVHFHCSFFQDKTVPPGGNTTFDVIFLARQVGNVENTLYIHTSIGSVRYQVFGVGVPNPYRLRPYLGARVPINSSFSPVIQMHNPHNSKIQVLEMFSSEGDLHLELPSGERDATQDLWELKPYETKSVMRANFVGRVESNHTAFIRIKTDKDSSEQLLVLPVEVEFSAEPGIYSPVELLDFGILRTLDDPKTLRLNLLNTGAKAAHITSVSVSPPNDAISIDFRPLKLQPDSSRQYTVAHVTFRAVKALHSKQWLGKIIVKTKNSQQKLVIPYQASVLHGSLVYNSNTTKFFSAKALRNFTRPLTLTNTFNFSVVIFNISLPHEATPFFSVLNFSTPVIVGPQQTVTVLMLLFHPNATQLHLSTTLTLHTNASTFLIPIIVYNGLLKVIHHRPEKSKGQMDFGTMGVGEKRSMIFTIRNDNPVDLVMARFEANMSWAQIEVLGMEKGNGTALTHIHNTSDLDTDPLIIKPYHYAVFTINIVAPQEEGAYAAEVWMFTQFEDLFIPITFRTAKGSLHAIPEKFLFEKVFPGKVPYKVLQIHSTFHDFMEITQVAFQPQDTRFFFQRHNQDTVLLKPQETTVVGKIFFDSKRECKDDCYVGLPTVTPAGHQWLLGLTLDKDVADTDQYLYTRLQQKWHRLERTGQNTANVTIELDTNQVRGFLFSAQAHLHWPSLVRKSKLKFPLTQIGNITVSDFIVENTADMPLLVQVLPLSLYPNPGTIIDLTSHGLSSDLTDFIETEDLDTFRLFDLEYTKPGSTYPVFDHIKNVENSMGVTPHKNSIAAILQPAQKLKIKIAFQPRDDLARSSLILIRNNLTIMDTVVVTGQGCRGEMKFSNRKPGSASPLTFEMTEKHLKNCEMTDKKSSKLNVPHFTVRRQFTIRNTGMLSFYVQGFSINDSPCEGYGFKVLDCEGFEMLPNTSRKVDIAFTPDFTMSRIHRVLTVHTSLGPASNYTLQATVPPHLLSKCSAALPRPHWEPVLYYSIICIMSFLFFCICLAAYFEGDRIIMADIIHRKLKVSNSTQTFDKSKVFDLRNAAGLNASPPRSPPAVSSILPAVMTQDLRAAAAKSMIHVNGHVEFHQTNGHRPLLGSVISFLQLLNPKRLFHSPSKISVPKVAQSVSNDSNSKDPDTPLTGSCKTVDNQLSGQQDPLILDKMFTNNIRSSRKPKPGKRHLVEIVGLTYSPTLDDSPDFKLTKDPNIPSAAKKMAEAENDQRDSALDTAEDFLDDETSPKIESSFCMKLSAGKLRGKKLRAKTRGERDLLKEKLIRRDNSIPDDKDETSSTTTDSSAGGEQDDKNSNARDSTPEPYIPVSLFGTRKPKKNKQDKVVAAVFNGDVNDDDNNFELTSKSRAHRKIRVNPRIFGGDIMRPSTLELDYTLPKEKEKHGAVNSVDPPRRSNKVRIQPKSDLLLCTVDGDDSDRDSPPPDWDQPTSCSPIPGDLSELSIQTESFAQRAGTLGEFGGFGMRPAGSLSPEQMSVSSRSSSYSSIVSATTTAGAPGALEQHDPALTSYVAGRNPTCSLSDSNRFPPGFPPYSDTALTALATQKTDAGYSAGGARPNGWTTMTPSVPVNTQYSSGFSLQPFEEDTAPFYVMQPPNSEGFVKPDFFCTGDSYMQFGDGSEHNLTMMQQLQVERRQRFLQFQKRKKENWPGFDVPPIRNDSLWDTDYNPLDPHKTWTSPSEPPATSSSGGFWSTLTNSASSGWNSLQNLANIWSPSNPAPVAQNSSPTPPSPLTPQPITTSAMAHNSTLRPEAPPFTTSDNQPGYVSSAAASAAAVTQSQVSSSNTFSPFSTPMADIWKPASTSNCGDTTWGQFLPPPVKDDN